MYEWFLAISGVLLFCGVLTAYGGPRWFRWVALICVVGSLPFAYIGATELLGLPKPRHVERLRADAEYAEVRGWHILHGEAIYLLLHEWSWPEPRYYVYPWTEDSEQMARRLRQGSERAQAGGQALFMFRPFDPYLGDEQQFRLVPPQPATPPKQGEGDED